MWITIFLSTNLQQMPMVSLPYISHPRGLRSQSELQFDWDSHGKTGVLTNCFLQDQRCTRTLPESHCTACY